MASGLDLGISCHRISHKKRKAVPVPMQIGNDHGFCRLSHKVKRLSGRHKSLSLNRHSGTRKKAVEEKNAVGS
jgi:hypothetical protein